MTTAPAQTDAPSKQAGKGRRWWRWILGLAVLAVIGWGTLRWAGERAAEYLQDQLARHGVRIEWDSAEWTTGPGVRLKNLRVTSEEDAEDTRMEWSQLTLRKGKDGWTSAVVSSKDTRLKMTSRGKEVLLENLFLELLVDREGLVSRRCETMIQGLSVALEARLKWDALRPPAAAKPDAATAAEKRIKPALTPVLAPILRAIQDHADFSGSSSPPRLRLVATAESRESGLVLQAAFAGRDLVWRGHPAGSLDAAANTVVSAGKPGPVHITRLTSQPGTDQHRFQASLDLETWMLTVAKADTRLDVFPLLFAATRAAPGSALRRLNSPAPLHLEGAGKVPLKKPRQTSWKGTVTAPAGLVFFAVQGQPTQTGPLTLPLEMAGGRISLGQTTLNLWSGSLRLDSASLTLDSPPRFEARLDAGQLHLPELLASFGSSAALQGRLDLAWNGGGALAPDGMRGGGTFAITESAFYTLPLLGPLHLVFDKLAPGFAKDSASTMTGRYALNGGALRLDDIEVKSAITQISAEGDVDLNRKHAKMTGKANLRGIAGLPTALLSELLAVEGEGPLNDMRWSLKNVPGIGAAAGAVGAVGGAAVDVTKGVGGAALDATKEAGEAAKGVLEGAGKAAGGILKLPGKLLPGRKE